VGATHVALVQLHVCHSSSLAEDLVEGHAAERHGAYKQVKMKTKIQIEATKIWVHTASTQWNCPDYVGAYVF
jgi:hypothetical protein